MMTERVLRLRMLAPATGAAAGRKRRLKFLSDYLPATSSR